MVDSIHVPRLLVIVGVPLMVSAALFALIRCGWARLLFVSLVGGLLIYNGLGAAAQDVPTTYLVMYVAFVLAVFWGFMVAYAATGWIGQTTKRTATNALRATQASGIWESFVAIFVLAHLALLVYPHWRLGLVISPPTPEVFSVTRPHRPDYGTIGEVVRYVIILTTPLYLIGLYYLRHRTLPLVLAVLAPTYLVFVANAYVPRAAIVETGMLLFLGFWLGRPKLRPVLVPGAVIAIVFGILFLDVYRYWRLGQAVPLHISQLGYALESLVRSELKLIEAAAVPLITSGARVDLVAYLTWLMTIPVPGFLLSNVETASLNAEISEIIRGVRYGERGFYGVMAGLVAQSVYVFGKDWFWVQGLFLGGVAAITVRLVPAIPGLLFLRAVLVLWFGYSLSRGGVSALLPNLSNAMISFYALLAFWAMGGARLFRRRAHFDRSDAVNNEPDGSEDLRGRGITVQ